MPKPLAQSPDPLPSIPQERGTSAISPAVRAQAEGVLAQARTFIGRAQAAQAAVTALGAGPATAWRPGPDATGVYRRPPSMAERIMAAPRELVDGRWQPRETYDEATLAELAESIREHGVIADLLAIVNEYGELELIAGHRRKRAALAAGGRDVPVKVLEVTAAQAFELAIIDNDQRSDLTDLERGKAYERIIAEQQISEAELARRLGRARAYIQQRRKLAQACPELQQAYIGGQLGFTHVRAICDGSGGDHAVQQAVVAYEIKEIKAGRPDTATSLQERAERTVREQSGAALKKLGWKVDQYWQGNTQRHYHHAPTARPAEWSSAEILAAVREQRRPPDGATAAHLDGAARLDLERHGWRMSATACAPWTIAEKGKELIVGDAGDLAPQIAAAREALQKLADRFVKAGWAATWNHTTLTATPPEGAAEGKKKPKKPAPVQCRSISEAEKLIRAIEKGTWTPEQTQPRGSASDSYKAECERCKKHTSQYSYIENVRFCAACGVIVEAEHAAERARLAAYVDTKLGAWLDSAPQVGAALILLRRRDIAAVAPALADAAQRATVLREELTQLLWSNRRHFKFTEEAPAPAEPGHAVAAPAEAARPAGLDDLIARLAAIEEAIPGVTSYGMVVELGNRLGDISDALDHYADAVSDDARDALIQRMGEASAALDALALTTTQREAA